MKVFRLILLLTVCALIFPALVAAAVHYVSPTGSATWANSTNISTPCSTGVAFTNANAGDTVYFRGGTYNVPAKNSGDWLTGYYNVSHSGTSGNPIVFMAYPGVSGSGPEVPLFNGTSGGSGDIDGQSLPGYATIFSTYVHSYITFDGFSFQADNGANQARIVVEAGDNSTPASTRSTGCVVKNCILYGGTLVSASTDNHEGIFVSATSYLVISNCRIYSYHQSGNTHNTSGIKTYHCDHVSVQNCEISDCVVGVFYKSDTDSSNIRYNYFHDNNEGILITNDMAPTMNTDYLSVYQNLITNSGSCGIEDEGAGADSGTHGDDYFICNNTLYNNGHGCNMGYSDPGGHGLSFYNNIVVSNTGAYSLVTQDRNNWRSYLKTADHNQWGATFKTIRIGDNMRNLNYTSLSSWKASGQMEIAMDVGCGSGQNPGCGDLASDPLFENRSGKFNQIVDFRLASGSPCKNAARSGSLWPDMGANVDSVGLQSGQTTAINGQIKDNRSVIDRSGASPHCSIILSNRRGPLNSGELIFDIRGQRLGRDQIRPVGIYIAVKH